MSKWITIVDIPFNPLGYRKIHPSASGDVVEIVDVVDGMARFRRRGGLEQVPLSQILTWEPAP